ncbi:LuxR C-terminal-related transcriptional regulator [Streptomyces sp. NPDC048192]|uniref:helix-turn-helix transcriptional regulator n=1 Tax=Streptomyces sp. NPDC048192 TaxID=3365510 RepID=UPI00371EE182
MSQAIDTLRAASGAADEVSSLPVRGRRAELERLTQWVRRHVHRNGGGVLWIEGPAGAGRSRMLACAGSEAALAGARVLTGAAMARGSMTPLAPLLDALTADAEGFAHGLSTRARRESASYWLLREVAGRLRELTRERPVVLLVDDVHDCDDLTLLALRTLPVQLAGLPLMWVLTARTQADAPAVRSLRRDLFARQATQLALPPLAPEAVRQMALDLLGPRAAVAAPYLHFLDGLPGGVGQLCAYLRDLPPVVPGATAGPPDTQTVLAWLAARRLEQLSEDARELVLIASVLGGAFTVQHLSQVLERSEPALLTPLHEALAVRFLHAEDDRLAFPHPPLREAVAATLPRPVRLSVRRRSIEARAKAGVPTVALAAELIDGAEASDVWGGRILRDAARELALVAPGTAARYLRRAVELSEDVGPERQRLSAALVPLLWQTGDVAEAQQRAREVVQAPPDPVTHATVCLELARMSSQFRLHRPEVHVRHVHLRRDVPVSVKDQLLSITMLNRVLAGDAEDVLGAAAASPTRTRGVHPVGALTQRTLQSMSAARRQNWSDAVRLGDLAAADLAHLGPGRAAALPEAAIAMAWRASLMSLSGEYGDARAVVEEAVAEAERRGRRALLPLWRTARARLLLDGGRLAAAARELSAAQEAAEATGLSFTGEPALLCIRARVAFHTGDDAGIQACAAQADACLRSDDPQQRRIGAWITLLAAAYRGTHLTAEQLDAADLYLRSGFVHATVADPGDTVLLVRVALAAGLRQAAERAVEFADGRAQRNPRLPLFGAAAAHARGLLESDPAGLLAAAERYGSARPLLRAQALDDAGAFLEATAARDARSCFEQALEGYDDCGAERESRRTRSRLRKPGIKTAGGSGAPDTGWRGLTPAELGVVRLIARGATNRQAAQRLFLSPHTVNTHVRHAFEKLGVRSRVQLARLYLQEVDQPAAAPS